MCVDEPEDIPGALKCIIADALLRNNAPFRSSAVNKVAASADNWLLRRAQVL